jgi:AAA+ ATPase superfamily predicted ATPase
MEESENPYTPGAGTKPLFLADRSEEIEEFKVMLAKLKNGRSDQNIIVSGLRGVGKTVLLNQFEDITQEEGFMAAYHELTPESSLIDLVAGDLTKMLKKLKLSVKAISKMKSALSHIESLSFTQDGFKVGIQSSRITEEILSQDLTDLFLELGPAALNKGTGMIIILDEAQFAQESEYRALISGLHRVAQKNLPIGLAASGLPQIVSITGNARSYAERMFRFSKIGQLREQEAKKALLEPAKLFSVSYTPEAAKSALEWAGGYPFFIQQIGKEAWRVADSSPIDLNDVLSAIPIAENKLDESFYDVRLERTNNSEKKMLKAMASLGPGPYKSKNIAESMGKKNSKSISYIRDSLISKGLIYSTGKLGYVDFTVPQFAEYIRRVL